MGLFSKYSINKANVSGGGQYFDKPGEFLCEVDVAKAIETQDKGVMFVSEMLIVESNNDETPVGARRSYTALLAKPWGPANLKEFMTAVNGLSSHDPKDEKAIDAEDWDAISEEAIGESNPLKGERVLVVVYNKTKKDKTMGTRTKVLPAPKKEDTK